VKTVSFIATSFFSSEFEGYFFSCAYFCHLRVLFRRFRTLINAKRPRWRISKTIWSWNPVGLYYVCVHEDGLIDFKKGNCNQLQWVFRTSVEVIYSAKLHQCHHAYNINNIFKLNFPFTTEAYRFNFVELNSTFDNNYPKGKHEEIGIPAGCINIIFKSYYDVYYTVQSLCYSYTLY